MYQLLTFYSDERAPRHSHALHKAGDVMVQLNILLSTYSDCERIEVAADGCWLFTVNRKEKRPKPR